MPHISSHGWTEPPYFVTALSIGGIVMHRVLDGGTISQDQRPVPCRLDAEVSTDRDPDRHARLLPHPRSILMQLNQSGRLRSGRRQPRIRFPVDFHADRRITERERTANRNASACPARKPAAINEYYRLPQNKHRQRPAGPLSLNNDGVPVYLADPVSTASTRNRPGRFERAEITARKPRSYPTSCKEPRRAIAWGWSC